MARARREPSQSKDPYLPSELISSRKLFRQRAASIAALTTCLPRRYELRRPESSLFSVDGLAFLRPDSDSRRHPKTVCARPFVASPVRVILYVVGHIRQRFGIFRPEDGHIMISAGLPAEDASAGRNAYSAGRSKSADAGTHLPFDFAVFHEIC